MSLAPLLNAPPLIGVHATAAMAAFGLGIVQFVRSKGTGSHRALGWVWMILLQFGPFSLIHVLSLGTLATLPIAVLHAKHHRIAAHRKTMIALFAGALVIAGLFTLLPGRLMHEVALAG